MKVWLGQATSGQKKGDGYIELTVSELHKKIILTKQWTDNAFIKHNALSIFKWTRKVFFTVLSIQNKYNQTYDRGGNVDKGHHSRGSELCLANITFQVVHTVNAEIDTHSTLSMLK